MTLEQGIAHLKESLNDPNHNWCCEECKSEHQQLLMWLEELQTYRGLSPVLDNLLNSDNLKGEVNDW